MSTAAAISRYYLSVALESDATFGRGEGLAGLVDVEIDHDEAGCPFLGARALKGLLVEGYRDLRYGLGARGPAWDPAATVLFGRSGGDGASLRFRNATLPPDLLMHLHHRAAEGLLRPSDILRSFTAIRRQTAIDAATGAAETGSLRALRVVLKGTPLVARLSLVHPPADAERLLALLAACALNVRRGGLRRHRGLGRLRLLLHDAPPVDDQAADAAAFTRRCLDRFATEAFA